MRCGAGSKIPLKPKTDKGNLRINPILVLLAAMAYWPEAHFCFSVWFSYDLHQRISPRTPRLSLQPGRESCLGPVGCCCHRAGGRLLHPRDPISYPPRSTHRTIFVRVVRLSLCRFTHLVFRHSAPKARSKLAPSSFICQPGQRSEGSRGGVQRRTRSCSVTTSTASHGSGPMRRA